MRIPKVNQYLQSTSINEDHRGDVAQQIDLFQSGSFKIQVIQMKEDEMSRGQKNWQKLRNIILSKSLAHKQKDKKFRLFQKQTTVQHNTLLTQYHYKQIKLIQATPQPLYKDLLHYQQDIDATGKWVWEAEEITAYFLIHRVSQYVQQITSRSGQNIETFRVLELGAGSSGLAAITFSKIFSLMGRKESLELRVTDGQKENIGYLQRNLQLNGIVQGKASQLCWGDQQTIANLTAPLQTRKSYSFIIICDCLYFSQFHKQLLLTIDSYLAPEGLVLLVNPSRGDSMVQFLSLAASKQFYYSFIDFEEEGYCAEIKRIRQSPLFNADKDIPYFIEMNRSR